MINPVNHKSLYRDTWSQFVLTCRHIPAGCYNEDTGRKVARKVAREEIKEKKER